MPSLSKFIILFPIIWFNKTVVHPCVTNISTDNCYQRIAFVSRNRRYLVCLLACIFPSDLKTRRCSFKACDGLFFRLDISWSNFKFCIFLLFDLGKCSRSKVKKIQYFCCNASARLPREWAYSRRVLSRSMTNGFWLFSTLKSVSRRCYFYVCTPWT